ncbi:MAG: IS1634 family transposase [bacterium]|nr:IS1634 family transposase [bacterium]
MLSGEYEGSEKITHGYNALESEDKQINVGLDAVGSEGLVVYGKPLPGNENGIGTFPAAVEKVSELLGGSRTFVTDRIFATFENLWGLQQAKHHFVCPLSRKLIPKGWIEGIAESEFQVSSYSSQHDPKNVYRIAESAITLKPSTKVSAPDLEVRALVVHSERKAKDDREGREKALKKIEKRLEEIAGYLNRRRYAHGEYAKEQIEAALKPPFGRYIGYELAGKDGELTLCWWREEDALKERDKQDGKYVVVTDMKEKPAEEVFSLHKEQHVVESRHRNMKTDLVLRPIWLQNDKRVEALLYLYVIAVMIYSCIEVMYRRATGIRWTGRKVLDSFGDYCAHKISLSGEGEAWLLEEPSAQQKDLLDALGIGLPSETLAGV